MRRTLVAGSVLAAALWVAPSVPVEAAGAAPRDPTTFACPAGAAGPFTDTAGSPHAANIDCLRAFGIVSGKSATTFGTGDPVTRGQLATILARTLSLGGLPLDGTPAGFTDVDASVHVDAVNALANLGIITGTSATTFGPEQLASRAQTASIVARVLATVLPTDAPDAFADDAAATAHEANINGLAAVGVIGGTSATTFTPSADLSRGAAASLVARALDLAVETGLLEPPLATDQGIVATLDGVGSVGLRRAGLPGVLCVTYDLDDPVPSSPMSASVLAGDEELLALPTPLVDAGERLYSRQCVAGLDDALLSQVFATPADHSVAVDSTVGALAGFDVPLGTTLTAGEVVGDGGGEDGATGRAFVDTLDDGRTVCAFVEYDGEGSPSAARLVHDDVDEDSIELQPFDPEGGISDGCVGGLDPALVDALVDGPSAFAVEVATEERPDGALRGALEASTVLAAELTGAAEVPGPGDADGSGFAFVDAVGDGLLCTTLSAAGVDRVTMAHIHSGTADVAGPVVVPLTAPVFGVATACVEADQALVDDLLADPSAFYVNVHTTAFPAGAIRGQLAPA